MLQIVFSPCIKLPIAADPNYKLNPTKANVFNVANCSLANKFAMNFISYEMDVR